MCYIIITSRSLLWFLMTIIAAMLVMSAIVTPKWLMGPEPIATISNNYTLYKSPSVGIYTRCKKVSKLGFHCGSFDLDGFATDSSVYPPEWKASMFFISLGFFILSLTVILTLITCCRQSILGKSIHTVTGSAQVVSGISVMFALFLHPLGWGRERVRDLCGPEAEAFYPADCTIGPSMYYAIIGILLCFFCGIISLKAESGNMREKVRRRVEDGDRLVCIP